MFYCLASALIDSMEDVRQLALYCMVHLLQAKDSTVFSTHFVESVFFFNGYEKHTHYNQFPKSERQKQLFSLAGNANRQKRNYLYQMFLKHCSDFERLNIMQKLCQDVLGAFVDGDMVLDETTQPLLQDALTVLASDVSRGCCATAAAVPECLLSLPRCVFAVL